MNFLDRHGFQVACDTAARSAPMRSCAVFLVALTASLCHLACRNVHRPDPGSNGGGPIAARGKYLATIGVCEACHTPPAVPDTPPQDPTKIKEELQRRADPDWYRYLDEKRAMAGGVPFILRFGPETHGVVYTRNITPDVETGIGSWSIEDIVAALRTGRRKDGTVLFLFAPHTFFKNLTRKDAEAIAHHLKTLLPVKNRVPERSLPFPPELMEAAPDRGNAPSGRTRQRAQYLMDAIVGCKECHSHHDAAGKLVEFVGGDPRDPFVGVFRLGPDLPLRATEKGFAAFPFPGYAALYGSNLTRFGAGGDLGNVSPDEIAGSMRSGISVRRDIHGRPRPLAHVMMWNFYRQMKDDDALAIADYLKTLTFVRHDIGPHLVYFGEDWRSAFTAIFGQQPSRADAAAFGKL